MAAIVFPDIPPHVIEVTATGPLPGRLLEYATVIEEACGPSILTRDLREATIEIEWHRAKENQHG